MGYCGLIFLCLLATCSLVLSELLQNGGFENSLDPWHCWNFQCDLVPADESRFGIHSVRTRNRRHTYEGPSQEIQPVPGKLYRAKSWVKLLNDHPDMIGQTMELEISQLSVYCKSHQVVPSLCVDTDGQQIWFTVAHRPLVTTSDGWILMQGDFQTPSQPLKYVSFYYQGPQAGVDYAVDLASITEISADSDWRRETDANIEKLRKSNITVNVQTAQGIDQSQVQIRVVQTRKSFPFGTCINSWTYVDGSQQKYRDFVHQHFNWAVLENALKWTELERHQGQLNYDRALKTIDGLKNHGLKVRGHNMVWSVEQFIPEWVRSQSGNQLRDTVRHHIERTLNITHGLLEHWDVNNENLDGQWYQDRLNDRDYDLQLFRMMYQTDPYPKLFLNDYNVVASGAATNAYREQAQRFQDNKAHMYGIGAQTHFGLGVDPNPTLMKQRLDTLATVGVPIWATELDVSHQDENVRADGYEKALRALYGHPAVEGIMFWGFWGDIQSAGQSGALVTGPNLDLTAAGRRVLDLFENQWMTDETHSLSQSGDRFSMRGFHGDYELHVRYQGRELNDLKQTFTLGKGGKSIDVNVHT